MRISSGCPQKIESALRIIREKEVSTEHPTDWNVSSSSVFPLFFCRKREREKCSRTDLSHSVSVTYDFTSGRSFWGVLWSQSLDFLDRQMHEKVGFCRFFNSRYRRRERETKSLPPHELLLRKDCFFLLYFPPAFSSQVPDRKSVV